MGTLSRRRQQGIRSLMLVEARLGGRSANTWHVTDLIESVTPPWTPYKYPPVYGIQDTTLYL
jgi:hypothetical protein